MIIAPRRHLNPSGITGKQAAAASRPVKEKCYLESYHNQNPLMFPKHSKASASGCFVSSHSCPSAGSSSGGRDESSHLALKDNLPVWTVSRWSHPWREPCVHLSYALRCNRVGHHHHHHPGFMAQSQIPALISSRLLYSNHLTHLDIFGWTDGSFRSLYPFDSSRQSVECGRGIVGPRASIGSRK